jgi:hypothetical protein
MKSKQVLLTVALLGSIYFSKACKKIDQDTASYIEITTAPKATFILPVEDLVKCSSSTSRLSANIIEFAQVAIKWSSSESSFQLLSMTLEAKSPILAGGKYSCNIVGNELNALMPIRTIAAVTPGSSSSITSSSSCGLRCGGVKVTTGAVSGNIPAKIKILGIETLTADGTQIPVTQTVDVSLIYKEF